MDQPKPKILINNTDSVIFNNGYLSPFLEKYFDIVIYQSDTTYSANEYSVVTNRMGIGNWYDNLVDNGSKLIYDSCWEHHVFGQLNKKFKSRALVLASQNYFWINEYYWYKSLNYNNYIPNKKYTHKALLPIRQLKPHRKNLLQKLDSCLDQLIYSTVDNGRYLPDDASITDGEFQRYFNPSWYNSTYFTIVSESIVSSEYCLHITEKTFKPIAFYHPFVVFGQPGTLEYLHKLGFETFENLFDETYDEQINQEIRLDMIVDNIIKFKTNSYDQRTLDKILYNHNLFFDDKRVEQIFLNDIINPLLEYVN
jgi:hypothetical protein